jgi:hypothetical protein
MRQERKTAQESGFIAGRGKSEVKKEWIECFQATIGSL